MRHPAGREAGIVRVRASPVILEGDLQVPETAVGVVSRAAGVPTWQKMRCPGCKGQPCSSWADEEPGTLDRVAEPARDWFLRHLPRTNGRR